jgi:WD40 repeat protein
MRRAALLLTSAACGRVGFDARRGVDAGCTLGPWSTPVELTQLSSDKSEFGPVLAPDGLTLYFHSNRPGVGGTMCPRNYASTCRDRTLE